MRISIEQVPAPLVYELRKEALRPTQPLAASRYPSDNDPANITVAAYADRRLIGTGSIFPETFPVEPALTPAWRIRGMAVRDGYRGAKIGEQLLTALIAQADTHGAIVIWCNARLPAKTFYARAGFVGHGDIFELPSIGPHLVMALPRSSSHPG